MPLRGIEFHTEESPQAILKSADGSLSLKTNKGTVEDYLLLSRAIPSAVFSQPPIGQVGLTEEQAVNEYGDVDIFTANFRPLKATLSGLPDRVFLKLIGFTVAVKAGLTKAELDATVGIHPTSAEEFVTMRTPTRKIRNGPPPEGRWTLGLKLQKGFSIVPHFIFSDSALPANGSLALAVRRTNPNFLILLDANMRAKVANFGLAKSGCNAISNLVKLEGFCVDPDDGNCYLVYEYVENGSLHSWLHDNKKGKLTWRTRLRIAIDVANGLQYIPEHTREGGSLRRNPPSL
ncbi:hypothetical protein TEA_009228 [Camellia sinensis var. sinensis]|uniref:Protein kinase domain-containing protein n=1 Tax=Camellia sinensis var. sinensis TaxID=542762 RepID=A0A4S4EER7_CAMSN|nr:hypothetical protein TEA_009228 [Camellia sinensis var. sinensis]